MRIVAGLALVLVVGGVGRAEAQKRLVLDEEAVRKHLVAHPEPVAPAGAAGRVVLLVEIGADGHVTEAKADSGPSRLRGAAVDAVKHWTFSPFLSHGEKVGVDTKLVVPVGAGEAVPPAVAAAAAAAAPVAAAAAVPAPETQEARVAREYMGLEDRCHKLVSERAEPAEEVKVCVAAANEAAKFGTDRRYIERRSAYVFAATALMRTDDLKGAVGYGTRAVEVTQQGHDDAAGTSAAFTVRAQAEAFAGNLPKADQDLQVAETIERQGFRTATDEDERNTYRSGLQSLLTFHARVLTAMGKKDAADRMAAEAGKL